MSYLEPAIGLQKNKKVKEIIEELQRHVDNHQGKELVIGESICRRNCAWGASYDEYTNPCKCNFYLIEVAEVPNQK